MKEQSKQTYPDFSERLTYVMILRDCSNKKLAELIYVTPAAISAYKNGKRRPGFEELRSISNSLQVSVDYLLGLTDTISNTK